MGRRIINLVLILIVQKTFSISARIDDEATCQLNPQMEKQCSFYTYSIVRPLLDYFRQSREELQRCETKDKIIKDYQEKLVHQEINEALIKQLRSQLYLKIGIIDDLSSKLKSVESCKTELANKSNKLTKLEAQLKKVHSSLNEANRKYLKTLEESNLRFEEDNKKILKKENDLIVCRNEVRQLNKLHESCKAEIKKIEKRAHNTIPSNCIAYEKYPGVHEIKIDSVDPFKVLCDSQLAGPGWIVIQQRIGGSRNFNRDLAAYREGFGSMESDFSIHLLTKSRRHELYVHLVALNGSVHYARYDHFELSDEDGGYALSLGEFSGDIRDALRDGENMKFSTFDRDNDFYDDYNCAEFYKSGWWYNKCYVCNLNAAYGPNLNWGKSTQLKRAKMLIRPKE